MTNTTHDLILTPVLRLQMAQGSREPLINHPNGRLEPPVP